MPTQEKNDGSKRHRVLGNKSILFGAIAIAAIALLAFGATQADAATITVDDSGGADYTTIQAAIDAATDGDTINVAAGTYAETLDLKGKQLTIAGAGIGSTTIDASSSTGYAISNFGDHTTFTDVTLIGSGHYGFKVSSVSDITLQNIRVQDSGKTGVDLNTVAGATLDNIEVVDTVGGFGIMILDSNNVSVTDITTSNNPWGGVSVHAVNADADNITFSGTFDAQESVPLLLEQDPPYAGDFVNVDVPDKFDYVAYGERQSSGYRQWFYNETLSGAKAFADGLITSTSYTYIDVYVRDVAGENYYVIPGMLIQDAVDAATSTTIHVDAGTYIESVTINKSIDLVGAGVGDTILQAPASPANVYVDESNEFYTYCVGILGGTYSSGNNTVWGTGTITVNMSGFTIDANDTVPTDRWCSILCRNVNKDHGDGVSSIHDNELLNVYVNGKETFGILGYGDMELTVAENTLIEFGRGGIGFYSGSNEVIDNTVEGPYYGDEPDITWAPNGIQFGYGASGLIQGNEVTRCGWPGSEWAGTAIMVVDTSNVVVDENYVHDNEDGIAVIDYPEALYGSSWAGACSDITVTNNTIKNNRWGLTLANEISNVRVEENDFLDNTYRAISIYDYELFYPSYDIPDPTNIEIHYNNFEGNGVGYGKDALKVYDMVTETVNATHNWWGALSGPSGDGPGAGDAVRGNVDYMPYTSMKTRDTASYLFFVNSSSGRVGVGTDNPQAQLDIRGNVNITTDNAGVTVYNTLVGTGAFARVYTTSVGRPALRLMGSEAPNAGDFCQWVMRTDDATMRFNARDVSEGVWKQLATFDYLNERMGIGLSGLDKPEHTLHVNGAINLDPTDEPTAPSTGFVIYCDGSDGKLKAKASNGTITELATP